MVLRELQWRSFSLSHIQLAFSVSWNPFLQHQFEHTSTCSVYTHANTISNGNIAGCVYVNDFVLGVPFVLVLLSAREISIFIMLLSHYVLKWYQDVIKSRPILFCSIAFNPPTLEIDGTNIPSHLSQIQITLQVKQRQWGQLVIC